MATFRFSPFLILFIFVSILSTAQTAITGTIIDSKTQQPIAHAEVFISGTTKGCISDSLGNFSLVSPYFPCTLVADHVSYESFIKPLNAAERLNIKLTPSVFSINEVSVSGKNKRKKNLRYFYSHFIPENRNKIKILNDSVLIFDRDEMQFTARSNEALIMENYHIGYRIRVILEEFQVIASDGPNGKRLPLNSIYGGEIMQVSGYYFYESLENEFPLKKLEYQKNRRLTYYGSYRHFLKSIYDNNPEQQGYEILTPSKNTDIPLFQVYENETNQNYKQMVINADTLNITYHFDDKEFPIPKEAAQGRYYLYTRKSTIYATRTPFLVRANGTSPQLSFIIDGLMTIKSFANSLPEDYIPPRK